MFACLPQVSEASKEQQICGMKQCTEMKRKRNKGKGLDNCVIKMPALYAAMTLANLS